MWELFSFFKIIIVTLRLVSQSHGSVHACHSYFVYVSFLRFCNDMHLLLFRLLFCRFPFGWLSLLFLRWSNKRKCMPAWKICITKHLSERQKLSHFFYGVYLSFFYGLNSMGIFILFHFEIEIVYTSLHHSVKCMQKNEINWEDSRFTGSNLIYVSEIQSFENYNCT